MKITRLMIPLFYLAGVVAACIPFLRKRTLKSSASIVTMPDGACVMVSIGYSTVKLFLLDPQTKTLVSEHASFSINELFDKPSVSVPERDAVLIVLIEMVRGCGSFMELPFGELGPQTPGFWRTLQEALWNASNLRPDIIQIKKPLPVRP